MFGLKKPRHISTLPTLTTSCRAISRQLIWVDRSRYQHGREGNPTGTFADRI